MDAIDYLNRVITKKSAYVPVKFAESVRNAAMSLGYRVCTGAYSSRMEVVIYLD